MALDQLMIITQIQVPNHDCLDHIEKYTMLVDMSPAVYSVKNTTMVSKMKQITILSANTAMIHQSKGDTKSYMP